MSSHPPGEASWGPDLQTLRGTSGVIVGSPVIIRLSGSALGRRGAILRSRLASPVQPGGRVVFAYFNPHRRVWVPVPTVLSADRRTAIANVHHFSVWDTIDYGAGWLFDTRVDAPKCDGPPPDWVSVDNGVVYVDDENAPLRWCVGHDRDKPSTLVVKVNMNRSYGTALYPAAKPLWTYDDLFGTGPRGLFTSLLARDLSVPPALRSLFGGELPLVPGIEVDMGFTEAQVRSIGTAPLVHVGRVFSNALAGLLYSAIEKTVGLEDVAGKRVAAIAAFVAIAQCESDVGQPVARHDWSRASKGILDCLTADPEATSKLLALALTSAFPKASPEELGKLAGRLGGKLLLVAAAGAVFDIGTWVADQHLDQSAFDLSVFPTIKVKRRPRAAPVTTSSTTPPVNMPTTTTTPRTGSLTIGSHFDSECVVAWPTAPVITSTSIQMTMSCGAVPENEYLFTQVDYGDPNLPISPEHAQAHVIGTIVDIASSAYGYKELVVQASSVQVK
jgi:hypothetical protein